MAAKKRKDDPTYRMWLVDDEERAVMVKIPERIFFMAHGTLSNASRRGATLKAQDKVVEAFVREFTKQQGIQIGDAATWKTIRIAKTQSSTAPRR